MTDHHPIVISTDGASAVGTDGTALRLVAYHRLGVEIPELHWVPASILEVCRG